jgi:hypothetical protein
MTATCKQSNVPLRNLFTIPSTTASSFHFYTVHIWHQPPVSIHTLLIPPTNKKNILTNMNIIDITEKETCPSPPNSSTAPNQYSPTEVDMGNMNLSEIADHLHRSLENQTKQMEIMRQRLKSGTHLCKAAT